MNSKIRKNRGGTTEGRRWNEDAVFKHGKFDEDEVNKLMHSVC